MFKLFLAIVLIFQNIRIEVKLVQVPVTVVDMSGRLITGLEKKNFRIFQDNKEYEIEYFSDEDTPVSVGIVLDVSESMTNKLNSAKQSIVEFLKSANPVDEFFLITFDDQARLEIPFTPTTNFLTESLLFIPIGKRTALLDAIYLAASQMKFAKNAHRAILVLTDGGDNHSRYNEHDIKNILQESDIQFYSIGIIDPPSFNTPLEELLGPVLLNELSEMTGGRSFILYNINPTVGNDKPTVRDLPALVKYIGLNLRSQYILGYRPENKLKKGKHKIKVKMQYLPREVGPVNIYTRSGYIIE